MLQCVYSGGQTGVDIAALRAAKNNSLFVGGYVPHGWANLVRLRSFNMTEIEEMPLARALPRRSRLNVDCSHGTLAIRLQPSRGTDATISYACTSIWQADTPTAGRQISTYRPTYVLTDLVPSCYPDILGWLRENSIGTLNVAGHRDTHYEPGVEEFLSGLFAEARSP